MFAKLPIGSQDPILNMSSANCDFWNKLVQKDGYLFGFEATDCLVLQHQGIISYNAEYSPMRFQLFMG